jgi:hypothetical protein
MAAEAADPLEHRGLRAPRVPPVSMELRVQPSLAPLESPEPSARLDRRVLGPARLVQTVRPARSGPPAPGAPPALRGQPVSVRRVQRVLPEQPGQALGSEELRALPERRAPPARGQALLGQPAPL